MIKSSLLFLNILVLKLSQISPVGSSFSMLALVSFYIFLFFKCFIIFIISETPLVSSLPLERVISLRSPGPFEWGLGNYSKSHVCCCWISLLLGPLLGDKARKYMYLYMYKHVYTHLHACARVTWICLDMGIYFRSINSHGLLFFLSL